MGSSREEPYVEVGPVWLVPRPVDVEWRRESRASSHPSLRHKQTGEVTAPEPPAHAAARTTIVVRVGSDRGPAPTHLLGVNHHDNANGYHLWDPAAVRLHQRWIAIGAAASTTCSPAASTTLIRIRLR